MSLLPLSNMRIIDKTLKNIKSIHQSDIWISLAYVCLFSSLFGIAFASGVLYERAAISRATDVVIKQNNEIEKAWNDFQKQQKQDAQYFGSRNGSTFYPLGCSSGNRIKESNRVFFHSIKEAQEAGYNPSSWCS